MKNREIDELFRKKLEAHGAEPSADAWRKVESEIQPGKESWKFYVGIAASLLVLFVISIILFVPKEDEKQDMLADNQADQNVEVETPAEIDNEVNSSIPLADNSETDNNTDNAEEEEDKGTDEPQNIIVQQDEVQQQFVATAQANPVRKRLNDKDAVIQVAPNATFNWDGDKTRLFAGASAILDAGRTFGSKLDLQGRFSAFSDFSAEDESALTTRFLGAIEARYRLTRNTQVTAIYTDDFDGRSDFSIGGCSDSAGCLGRGNQRRELDDSDSP